MEEVIGTDIVESGYNADNYNMVSNTVWQFNLQKYLRTLVPKAGISGRDK